MNKWVYYNQEKKCIEICEYIKKTIVLKDKTIIDEKWYIKDDKETYKCKNVALDGKVPKMVEYVKMNEKNEFENISYNVGEYIEDTKKNKEKTIELMNKIMKIF
jgi:hypothetical protein